MSVKIGGKRYYDTGEIAEKIGKTPRMVRVYITAGKLKGKRVNGTWLVSQPSLDRFIEKHLGGPGQE
jgi:predicted transcriptional regulator